MLSKAEQQSKSNIGSAISDGFRSLGFSLSHDQLDDFSVYLSLLLKWNARINLTAIRDPLLIVRRHFLDSGAMVRFLTPLGRLLDVGSGAGLPGLPLRILLPGKEIFLLEAQRKKANFLREVIRRVDLKGAQVIEDRFEKISLEDIGEFDEVITRALTSKDVFLQHSFRMLRPGGRSIIMHGPKGREIFPALEDRAREIGFCQSRMEMYLLPWGNEQRTALIFSKS